MMAKRKTKTAEAYEIRFRSGTRIAVVLVHIYNPDHWVMHCPAIGFDMHEIPATSAIDAKNMALEIVRSKLRAMADELNKQVSDGEA